MSECFHSFTRFSLHDAKNKKKILKVNEDLHVYTPNLLNNSNLDKEVTKLGGVIVYSTMEPTQMIHKYDRIRNPIFEFEG